MQQESKNGVIYILTNPSFPDYVKIGYADDIGKRLQQLNRSECIPFAFRVYATYEVNSRLSDLKIHTIIDKLNPNLRSIENFNGQKRVREFYLFIGKSIGTTVSVDLADKSPNGDRIRFVLYTPLKGTFAFPFKAAVAFTGTDDLWVGGRESRIAELCREKHIPCFVIPEANHSLETGNPLTDIENLRYVMEETKRFMAAS